MTDFPQRRTPPHFPPLGRFGVPIILFVTVCTKDRKRILARPDVHRLLRDIWTEASEWLVGRYVLMPDHIHLFCGPGVPDARPLAKWMHYWKSRASQRWPRRAEHPVWQRSFWDTQLRKSESYEQKWQYVLNNPVRYGLVTDAKQWPYAGELYELHWD